MWEQVSEADEFFPVCRCVGQAAVKPSINYQIWPQRIRYGPESTDRVRPKIRLREMPQLSGYGESLQPVGDRERLSALSPPGAALGFLSHYEISVIVKAHDVIAQQECAALTKRAAKSNR